MAAKSEVLDPGSDLEELPEEVIWDVGLTLDDDIMSEPAIKKKKKRQGKSGEMSNADGCGRVYVARIRRSQKHPRRDGVLNINVTSGSGNKVDGIAVAKAFSPLYAGPVVDSDGLVFKTVEGFWQGNKVYKELGHLDKEGKTTQAWESFRREQAVLSKGARHPACLKTKEVLYVDDRGRNNYKYLTPVCAKYDGEMLGYIESRKKAYAPKYYQVVTQKAAFKALKAHVDGGQSVMVLDFDGPKEAPDGCEVNVDYLKAKINDPSTPFGHGYVLAGALLGIEPGMYTE